MFVKTLFFYFITQSSKIGRQRKQINQKGKNEKGN